jgi:hypothetical protein
MGGQYILPYIIDSKYAIDLDSLEHFFKSRTAIINKP